MPSQEISEFLPRFNSDPGRMHAEDGNPNVYIDPSKKLTMYAHVTSSDTVLQRYNIVGLPTVSGTLCRHDCVSMISPSRVLRRFSYSVATKR